MNQKIDNDKQYQQAKKQLKRIQLFYIHLAGYLILVALILLNFYVMEEGPYTSAITALNLSVLVGWTVFIGLHAWRVFKEKKVFKKEWEEKKIEEFLKDNDEETTLWE